MTGGTHTGGFRDRLPGHSVDGELWQRIEQRLEGMDASPGLQDKLPVHRPPASLWNGIAGSLDRTMPVPVHRKLWFQIISGAGVVLLATLLWLLSDERQSAPGYFLITDPPQRETPVPDEPDAGPAAESKPVSGDTRNFPAQVRETRDEGTPVPDEKAPGSITSAAGTSQSEQAATKTEPAPAVASASRPPFGTLGLVPLTEQVLTSPPRDFYSPISIASIRSAPEYFPDMGFRPGLELGFYTETGRIFNQDPDHPPIPGRSAGLDLEIRMKGFFLRTGAGLMATSGEWDYRISFLKNDLVGSYEKVDSVLYFYDTLQGTLRREYMTSLVYVYDSVPGRQDDRIGQRHLYLNIPFLVGMEKSFGRITWTLAAGPVLSFRLHEKTVFPEWHVDQARIVGIENRSLSAVETNLHLMAATGLVWHPGGRISVSVEPVFRYYYKPIYRLETAGKRRSYYTGLRAGIRLGF